MTQSGRNTGRRNRAGGDGNPLWVAASPRAAMLEATGKDQRQASRTLRVADSGERDAAAPSCDHGRGPLRDGLAADAASSRPRATPGCPAAGSGVAKVIGAQVRDPVPDKAAIATKVRESSGYGDAARAGNSAAKRPHSLVEDARLKIVVSPVRVRVSPLSEIPANRPVSGPFGGPRKRVNSGTRTVIPGDSCMVVALICASSAQCMPVLRDRQAADPRPSGRRPYAGARVP